jgi:hypothetical protein
VNFFENLEGTLRPEYVDDPDEKAVAVFPVEVVLADSTERSATLTTKGPERQRLQ